MADKKKKEMPKENKFADTGLRGFTLYDKDGNPKEMVKKKPTKK